MLLDPDTGLTTQQASWALEKIIDNNREDIDNLISTINNDYEVPEETLDEILSKFGKEQLTPNDFRILLRAVAEDYNYLTRKNLDDEYVQSVLKKINDLKAAREWMKSKNKVVPNA
jgi:asparagine synthetase A